MIGHVESFMRPSFQGKMTVCALVDGHLWPVLLTSCELNSQDSSFVHIDGVHGPRSIIHAEANELPKGWKALEVTSQPLLQGYTNIRSDL